MTRMVAIDPGRAKCGLVLVDVNRRLVLAGSVEPADQVNTVLQRWCRDDAGVNRILLGNGTSSADWQSRLQAMAPIELVEEAGTTLRARDRYWQLWPPRGWRRWIPHGLLLPPGDLDALAALVMLEDALAISCQWAKSASPLRNGLEP